MIPTSLTEKRIPARRHLDRTGAGIMAEHEHGTMDISAHEATFVGFVRWTVRVIVASLLVLVFLAIFNS